MKRVLTEAAIAVPMVLALLGILIAVAQLWTLVVRAENVPESTWGNVRLRSVTEMVILAVAAIALAPIFEEVFYRGFLYNALRRWCPATVAAIIQAAVFAATHQYNWLESTCVILVGLGLALVYQWRKTLLTPMFMHAGVNLTAMAMIALVMMENAGRPVLGVAVQPGQDQCLVDHVLAGSSAEKAGLRKGDVVVGFDQWAISCIEDLQAAVQHRKIGDRVRLEILRGGRRVTKEVLLEGFP